jgi:uncharacterized protein (TIGR03437 family)
MFIVGDGVVLNAVPLGGCCYGGVGTDLGVVPIQVTDDFGVPVAGVSVAWAASPPGSVILKSVTGVPGTTANGAEPFTPLACAPSSGARVTCPTDKYGIAWVDVAGGSATTNTATITASIPPAYTGNFALQFGVTLVPIPAVTPGGVVNTGSYQTTIAPGSYADIFGSNLVDPNFLINPATGDLTTFARLPMTLDAVTVSFDAPATGSLPAISVPGYLYFVSPGQVNLYVPWELENYPSAQVKVTFVESLYSNLVNVTLNNYAPAFLMNSGTVADAVDNTTGAIITASNPATAGEILQLYCNGLGPVSNQPPSGDPASTSASTLS